MSGFGQVYEKNPFLPQVENMVRAEAMKHVIGPALTSYLRPIYEQPLGKNVLAELPGIQNAQDLLGWGPNLAAELMERSWALKADYPNETEHLDELAKWGPGLFYARSLRNILAEAHRTSLFVPLIVASHIVGLESGFDFNARYPDIEKSNLLTSENKVAGAMSRPLFDAILIHLTKGPNGFLGSQSSA